MTTVHVGAKRGHINTDQNSSGTADFGVGYRATEDDRDDDDASEIEKHYNMRASQILEKFESSGRQVNLPRVDRLTDSIASCSINDRDIDDDDDDDVRD